MSKKKPEANVQEIKDIGRNAGYAASVMANKSDTPTQKKELIRDAKANVAAQLALEDKVHAPDRPFTEKAASGKGKSHSERARQSKKQPGQGELDL